MPDITNCKYFIYLFFLNKHYNLLIKYLYVVAEKNIVVRDCNIFNDSSIDISSDGKLLAAYSETMIGK